MLYGESRTFLSTKRASGLVSGWFELRATISSRKAYQHVPGFAIGEMPYLSSLFSLY